MNMITLCRNINKLEVYANQITSEFEIHIKTWFKRCIVYI